jgi:hypothetical protein
MYTEKWNGANEEEPEEKARRKSATPPRQARARGFFSYMFTEVVAVGVEDGAGGRGGQEQVGAKGGGEVAQAGESVPRGGCPAR